MKIYTSTHINQVKSEARQSFLHSVSNCNSIPSDLSKHLQTLRESRFIKKHGILYYPEDYISNYLPEDCVLDLNRFLRRKGMGVRRCLAALILYSLECGPWNKLTPEDLACIWGYKGTHANKTARDMMHKLISLGLVFKRRRRTTKGGSACSEYKVNPFFFQEDSLKRMQYSFDLVDKDALSKVIHKLPLPINIKDLITIKNAPRAFPEVPNLEIPYGRAPQIRHQVTHRPRENTIKGRNETLSYGSSISVESVLADFMGMSKHDLHQFKHYSPPPVQPRKELPQDVKDIFDAAFPTTKPGPTREELQKLINESRAKYLSQTPAIS